MLYIGRKSESGEEPRVPKYSSLGFAVVETIESRLPANNGIRLKTRCGHHLMCNVDRYSVKLYLCT